MDQENVLSDGDGVGGRRDLGNTEAHDLLFLFRLLARKQAERKKKKKKGRLLPQEVFLTLPIPRSLFLFYATKKKMARWL